MSFQYPLMVVVAAVVGVAMLLGYRYLARERTKSLALAGLAGATRGRIRQHLPPLVFLGALILLLLAVARPQATVSVPRATGTVILAFDVSNSMTAKDATPSRLAAAQTAATGFINAQPDTVDVGVVAFDQGVLTTRSPTNNHDEALAAVNRLHTAGGTSLGQAILGSLTAIVGKPVALPDQQSTGTPGNDLGYHGSATIVLLSDGEDTGGPDALAAAELAAGAGVKVETIGFGTTEGATIDVDGYQVATALNEDLLTQIAQATAATYHRAGDSKDLDNIYKSLDLRITAKPQSVELTGAAAILAVLLLMIGGLLMITWYGRIL